MQSPADLVLVVESSGHARWPQLSWCLYTGQTIEVASGEGWFDAIDPSDRESLRQRLRAGTATGARFDLDTRVWHAESSTFRRCHCDATPITDTVDRVVEWIATLRDVSEHAAALERERAMAERFRRIFAANVFGICYGERDLIIDGNDAFLETIGAQRRDLAGGILLAAVLPNDDGLIDTFANRAAAEYEIRRLDGSPGHVLAAGVSLAPEPGWLAVTVDLTRRKAAERAVAYLALHDPLTGLPNRRLLTDRLEHALVRSHRQSGAVALLFCDVDHFKRINDRYGHSAGDTVLQTFASRLLSVLRENDTVARAGGDEFVVVLEDLADPTEATRIAERARLALNEPIELDGRELRVTASVGVSLCVGPDDDAEALLRRADDAMYSAKAQGRDQIAFATDEILARRRNDDPPTHA